MYFNPGDSVTWDVPNYQGKVKLYISWSGHSSIYGDSTWNWYIYTDVDVFRIYNSGEGDKIYKNGVKLTDGYANTVIIDFESGTVEFYNGDTLVVSTTTGGTFVDKITLSCPTEDYNGDSETDFNLNNIYIYKYSAYLDTLNVYDENTLEKVGLFDFSEINNTITVRDLTGVRASRTYELSGATSLDAFLVPYSDASYYTISVDGAGAGVLVEALRDYGGQEKVVAQARTADDGKTSMILANSKLYTIRVHLANSTIERDVITDPNNPIIYVSSSMIGSAIYVNATGLAIEWKPAGGVINENTTKVSVKIADPSALIDNATLIVESGSFRNEEILTGSPTGGTLEIALPDISTLGSTVKATLTIYRANNTYNYTKTWMVDREFSSDFSIDSSVDKARNAFGVGKLGMLIGVVVLALVFSNALGIGSAGTLIIVMILYAYFGYKGWIDKELAILGLLGGFGALIRRREV